MADRGRQARRDAHARRRGWSAPSSIVEVEDHIWQRQLFTLSRQILANLAKSVGPNLVEDLEFKVVPRRRDPARATASVPTPLLDEADGIADPVLRDIYRVARKKALA